MRSEKDRDWELPFGSPGELSVLMDIRDELKQLNRQLALLAIEITPKEVELPPLPVKDGAAYPPPAPSPPPPAQSVRRSRIPAPGRKR